MDKRKTFRLVVETRDGQSIFCEKHSDEFFNEDFEMGGDLEGPWQFAINAMRAARECGNKPVSRVTSKSRVKATLGEFLIAAMLCNFKSDESIPVMKSVVSHMSGIKQNNIKAIRIEFTMDTSGGTSSVTVEKR